MSTGDPMKQCSVCGEFYYLIWGACPKGCEEHKHTLSKDCKCNPTIVNKNGYEYPASTRVRCTKDGEYPEVDQHVEFESMCYTKRVGFYYQDEFHAHRVTIKHSDRDPVYWQPLTSLKAQYERERGEK